MRKIHKLTALLALCLVFSVVIGTFAYFSDRVAVNAAVSVVGGDNDGDGKDDPAVDIEPAIDPNADPDDPNKPDPDDPDHPYVDPTPNNPDDDLTNWWAYLNSIANVNFNPGDKMTLNFYMRNEGHLDAKIRETFIITSDIAFTDAAYTAASRNTVFNPTTCDLEFELCSSVKAGPFGGFASDAVSGMTFTKLNDKQYKVTIQESSIAKASSAAKQYYLVFDAYSGNDFQGAKVTIDYLAEAMQANGDWVTAATGTWGPSGENAVPAA